MNLPTQVWSIDKESWIIGPSFHAEVAILHDHACSIALDRNNLLFIGGHYQEIRKDSLKNEETIIYSSKNEETYYVPMNTPLNDLVFKYNFPKDSWTKLQNVPNIQVSIFLNG